MLMTSLRELACETSMAIEEVHCLQTVQSLVLQFSSHLPGSSDAAADSAVVSAIKLSVIGTLVLLSGKGHCYYHHKWHCVVTLEGQLEMVTVANNSVCVCV